MTGWAVPPVNGWAAGESPLICARCHRCHRVYTKYSQDGGWVTSRLTQDDPTTLAGTPLAAEVTRAQPAPCRRCPKGGTDEGA